MYNKYSALMTLKGSSSPPKPRPRVTNGTSSSPSLMMAAT